MRAKSLTLGLALGLAAAGFSSTTSVAEQVPDGFYIGAGGGMNLHHGNDLESQGAIRDLDTGLGFVGLANFGYSFGNGLRTELEGGYRQNGIDSWGSTNMDGNVNAWHAMLNALYDFDTGTSFTPYVGGGLGAAFVTVDAENDATGIKLDGSDVAFAYQAILGLGYDIMDNLAVTADYRFFHALDLEHTISGGLDDKVGDDYMNHAFVLGLRYAFGTPDQPEPMPVASPPTPYVAPQVAPAPAPMDVPNSYLVFFDFDSATLTPEATSIVDTAASNALEVGRTRIEVTGHTDRAGSSQYNTVLSQRRADAVMQRLVAQGIPRNDIAVFARGEQDPLIPTDDGVREAQNRRVEIILL